MRDSNFAKHTLEFTKGTEATRTHFFTHFIIKLFHDKETNPLNAQLIFNTNDINLLTNKVFRRDQIWFTEKDKLGSTDLYSLVEYHVRKDASFGKDYLMGKYGAIPYWRI